MELGKFEYFLDEIVSFLNDLLKKFLGEIDFFKTAE